MTQNLTEIKGNIDRIIILVGDISIHLSVIERPKKKKKLVRILVLNSTINQLDVTNNH